MCSCGTPRLMGHRLIVSLAASRRKGQKFPHHLHARYDVSAAVFHAKSHWRHVVKAMTNGTRGASAGEGEWKAQWCRKDSMRWKQFLASIAIPIEWDETVSCMSRRWLPGGRLQRWSWSIGCGHYQRTCEVKILPRIGAQESGGAVREGRHLHRLIKWIQSMLSNWLCWHGSDGDKRCWLASLQGYRQGQSRSGQTTVDSDAKEFRIGWQVLALVTGLPDDPIRDDWDSGRNGKANSLSVASAETEAHEVSGRRVDLRKARSAWGIASRLCGIKEVNVFLFHQVRKKLVGHKLCKAMHSCVELRRGGVLRDHPCMVQQPEWWSKTYFRKSVARPSWYVWLTRQLPKAYVTDVASDVSNILHSKSCGCRIELTEENCSEEGRNRRELGRPWNKSPWRVENYTADRNDDHEERLGCGIVDRISNDLNDQNNKGQSIRLCLSCTWSYCTFWPWLVFLVNDHEQWPTKIPKRRVTNVSPYWRTGVSYLRRRPKRFKPLEWSEVSLLRVAPGKQPVHRIESVQWALHKQSVCQGVQAVWWQHHHLQV